MYLYFPPLLYQKQPPRGVVRKRHSENIQQVYRRTPMLCNFIEIALWHGCSSVNLLLISRTHFSKNTFGWLLLNFVIEDSKRSKILSFNSFDLLRDDFRYFHVYLVMWNRIIFTEQEIFSEAMFTWNMHKT